MTESIVVPVKSKLKRWHKVLLSIVLVVALLVWLFMWFISLIDKQNRTNNIQRQQPSELLYLAPFMAGETPSRGRILAVVTSTAVMGDSGKKTGYELTELSRAYYVFSANGFEVDIASPKGGLPPIVIDNDDMGVFDYAFLNDSDAQQKVSNSLKLENIDADAYRAVYFIGGKGAMFDFPDNVSIQKITSRIYQQNGIVGAVCHGPAALANVKLDDGSYLIENRTVSAFTNSEELFLIPDAKQIFPFLLEDKLRDKGANFVGGTDYLEQISVDGRLVTGQNPWSVWSMAEAMIKQLGYEPVFRAITAEENAVLVLTTFHQQGYDSAAKLVTSLTHDNPMAIDRNLVLMHAIVEAMKFDFINMIDLTRLVSTIKSAQES